MHKPNLLVITPWYPTSARPEEGLFVREFARTASLYGRVAVLHVMTAAATQARWQLNEEHDRTITAGLPTFRLRYRPLPIPRLSYPIYVAAVYRAFRVLARAGYRPDLMHAHVYFTALPTALIGRLYRIPVVYTEHFTGFIQGPLRFGERLKARLACRWVDYILPVSQTLRTAMEQQRMRGCYRVVPNVVDSELFRPRIECVGGRDNEDRLLFVGSLIPRKDLPTLLKALHQVDPSVGWYLDVVGDGPQRSECERLVESLGLKGRVSFRGVLSKAEVARMMRRSDLVVVPSLVETFSCVAAEALATGTRVLATRSGGPEEFVFDDVGTLVPPGDPTALAAALEVALMAERPDRQRISAYAVERFGIEAVAKQLGAVYDACLSRKARGTQA